MAQNISIRYYFSLVTAGIIKMTMYLGLCTNVVCGREGRVEKFVSEISPFLPLGTSAEGVMSLPPSVRPSVCPSVRPLLACLRDNSSSI